MARGIGHPATTEWGLTNSILSDVYAFGDHIAVVHRVVASMWDDPASYRGVDCAFGVFMNVFDAGGRGLVADLSLPDLPVGRDDDLLYVVDYGPAGRGSVDGVDSIRLLGISVEESVRAYLDEAGRPQGDHKATSRGLGSRLARNRGDGRRPGPRVGIDGAEAACSR